MLSSVVAAGFLKQITFLHWKRLDSVITLPHRTAYLTSLSTIEYNKAVSHYALATFVDAEKAYTRLCPDIAVAAFRAMGLRGRIMRFLTVYLRERSIAVELGASVSSDRAPSIALSQGSVLRSTHFNE